MCLRKTPTGILQGVGTEFSSLASSYDFPSESLPLFTQFIPCPLVN
jgi:hypothetical protein